MTHKKQNKCNCGYGDTTINDLRIYGHKKECNVYQEYSISERVEEKEKCRGGFCKNCEWGDFPERCLSSLPQDKECECKGKYPKANYVHTLNTCYKYPQEKK